jgi:hypothetical protein
MFKPRYLAELTLLSTCLRMMYLDCNGVLLVMICITLHLSAWSCISHWSSHFYNVSKSCCRVRLPSSDLILWYRLPIYCFMSGWRIFHLYGDILSGGGLQNLGLCLALRAFEQKVSLSCHTWWDTGPRILLTKLLRFPSLEARNSLQLDP